MEEDVEEGGMRMNVERALEVADGSLSLEVLSLRVHGWPVMRS